MADDTFATRRFTYYDADGNDHDVPKGTDLSIAKPGLSEQQLADWRGVGLVGANPAAPVPVTSDHGPAEPEA